MDRISDSGSDDLGSIPNGGTNQFQDFMQRTFIAFAVAFLVTAPVLSARTSDNGETSASVASATIPENRNEITVGYGRATIMDLAHVVGGVFATVFTGGYARFDNFTSYGSVNVEYYRVLNKTFSVGGAISWFGGEADYLNKDNVKVGTSSYSGFAVMPSAKAFWFRKPHVAMYSKLSAGLTLLDDYDDESDSHSFDPYFAAQVSLAGIQFGGERFRGYVELGGGMQGAILVGLSYSF